MSDNDLPSFGSNPLYRNGRVPTPSNSQGFLGGIDRAWDRFSKGLADSWANPDLSKLGAEPSSGKLLPSPTANPIKPEAYRNEGHWVPKPVDSSAGGLPTPNQESSNMSDADAAALINGVGGLSQPEQAQPAKPANQMDWDAMAKHLASLSQNRAQGGMGFAPQQQMGGWNSLPDYAAQQNADFDRRHIADNLPRGISDRERARLMVQMANNQDNNATAREGHQMNYAAQMAGQGITARGQDLNYAGHMANVGAHGQNGLMSAMAHLYGAKAASDDRREMNRENIEALAPSRDAQAQANQANAQLHQHQLAELQAGKNPIAFVQKSHENEIDKLAKLTQSGVLTPEQANARLEELDAAYRVARGRLEKHANGGVVGYAEGGSIFADDSQAGLDKRLAAMQSMNAGASVKQAYGGTPQFGSYTTDVSTDMGGTAYGDYNTMGKGTGVGGGVGVPSWQQRDQGIFEGARRMQSNRFNPTPSEWWSQNGMSNNFAEGGPIQVGGRQVLGPGTGKSDSIPAVIDGEQPAALSTGEFVMPVEAVQHFGLDRLNKMVAQARKGLDTGR